MNDTFFSKRFDGIQVLRAVAAIIVLINHVAFVGNGGFGVDIFFCISGFIMMYVTEKSTKNFISKRIIRIFPLYYAITLVTFIGCYVFPGLFAGDGYGPVGLIKSLLFVPGEIGGIVKPIVRVGWTLNYEMFFYLILWCSMHISHKYRGVIAGVVLTVSVIIGTLFNNLPVPVELWTDSILIEFIFGIVAFWFVRWLTISEWYRKCGNKNITRAACVVVALVSFIFMWFVKYNEGLSDIERCIIYGIPAFIIFVGIFIATYECELPGIAVFLGDISYSIYLIHYSVVRLTNKLTCPDGIVNAKAIIGAIGALVITLLMSVISYYLIEKKLVAVLSKFIRRQ